MSGLVTLEDAVERIEAVCRVVRVVQWRSGAVRAQARRRRLDEIAGEWRVDLAAVVVNRVGAGVSRRTGRGKQQG